MAERDSITARNVEHGGTTKSSSSRYLSGESPEAGQCYLMDAGPEEYDGGVSVLLCDPQKSFRANPKALFLGPKAENAELVEKMLLEVFRDHAFWRRNFHPPR